MHVSASTAQERDLALWRDRRWWTILLAAILFRIWSVAGLATDPRIAEPILDGKYYMELAERLASGQGWPPGPIFMTPLYPWVLSLLFRLTAVAPFAVQIFQAMLGLFTLVLLTATARRELGERTSLALGGLYVLCGPLLGIESQVLTESLLLFLASAALFYWPKPGQAWWRLLLFGVVAGLLATGRGVFLLVPLAAAIHYWLAGRSRSSRLKNEQPAHSHRQRRGKAKAGVTGRTRAKAPAAATGVISLLLGLGLALLPLAVHQTRSVGSLQILTLNGGMNFFIGNHTSAQGIYSLPPEIDLEGDFTAPHAASKLAGRALTLPESSRFWTERALRDLTADPGRWLRLWTSKALLFFSPREIPQIEDFQILRERHLPLRVALIDFAWLLPLAVLGCVAHFLLWRRSRAKDSTAGKSEDTLQAQGAWEALVPWLILVAVGWLSTILFFATGRYRTPFLAGFLGPAALGLVLVFQTIRQRRLHLTLIALPLTVAVQLMLPGYPIDKARAYDHNQAGLRLQRRGDASASLEEYRKATQIDPEDGLAWHGIGVALVHLNRLPEAAEAYRQALTRIPFSVLTHYNLGIVYGRMNQDTSALRELQEATRLDPFDVRIRADMAVALARTGHEAEAAQAAREALKRDPTFAPALLLLRQLGQKP
jgi:hypothetical protein